MLHLIGENKKMTEFGYVLCSSENQNYQRNCRREDVRGHFWPHLSAAVVLAYAPR